jgi:hypothetical protein
MRTPQVTIDPTVESLFQAFEYGVDMRKLVDEAMCELISVMPKNWNGVETLFKAVKAYEKAKGILSFEVDQSLLDDCGFIMRIDFNLITECSKMLDVVLKTGIPLNTTWDLRHPINVYNEDSVDVWYWCIRSGADHVSDRLREVTLWPRVEDHVSPFYVQYALFPHH